MPPRPQSTKSLWEAAHKAYTQGAYDRSADLYERAAGTATNDSLAVVMLARQATALGFAKRHIEQEEVLTRASIRAQRAGLDSLRVEMAVSAQNVRDRCETGQINCGQRVESVWIYIALGATGAFVVAMLSPPIRLDVFTDD